MYPYSQDQTNLIFQRQILACKNVSGQFKHSHCMRHSRQNDMINVLQKNILQFTVFDRENFISKHSKTLLGISHRGF